MSPDENQGLIIDLPEETVIAAEGWLPPKDEKADKVEKVVLTQEREEPETDDDKPKAKANGHDSEAIATIKRENDELRQRLLLRESESKTQLEERDSKLNAAETSAAKDRYYALRAHHDKVSGELNQIETHIRSTSAMLDQAERQLQAAVEAGDGKAQATAQRIIARGEAEMVQLEAGKVGAEDAAAKAKWHVENFTRPVEKKEPEAKEPKEEKKEPPRNLSRDEWLAQLEAKASPKAAQWVKDHPEFMSDPAKHKKFLAFAKAFPDVEDEPLSSSKFVEELDKKFGFAKEDAVDEEDDKPAPRKAAVVAAAPVGRQGKDVWSSKNPGGKKGYLRPKLAQYAKEIGSTPESYYNTVKQMIADGKYPKNYLDPDYEG